jgi:Aldehyde dehydrogenase family
VRAGRAVQAGPFAPRAVFKPRQRRDQFDFGAKSIFAVPIEVGVAGQGNRHADGSYKQMLVDGRWVDAASGKRFESRNPATGEVLATVAEGDAEDVNRAVAAARKAFEGPWSKFKPYQRQQLLLKLADLVERHFDELSALDTLDMGAPISRTRGTRLRVLGMLRYYAGQATCRRPPPGSRPCMARFRGLRRRFQDSRALRLQALCRKAAIGTARRHDFVAGLCSTCGHTAPLSVSSSGRMANVDCVQRCKFAQTKDTNS